MKHDVNVKKDRTRRPWRQTDGDSRCMSCGVPMGNWCVEDDVWDQVMGDAQVEAGGILCPNCFMHAADDAGLGRSGAWTLVPPADLE